MTDVLPPSPPTGVSGQFFPWRLKPYNNITPFTTRDGETYIDELEALKRWLRDTLVPYVDGEILEYVAAFNSALDEVNSAFEAIQAYGTGFEADIQAKIDAFNTTVTTATAAFNTLVTNANAHIDAQVTAAQTAATTAQQWAAQTESLQDLAVTNLVQAPASSTALALTSFVQALIAAADPANVKNHNAKGDGATDDTAAFNAASLVMHALGGGELHAPPGVYILNGLVSLNDGVSIRGGGAFPTVLKTASATGVMVQTGAVSILSGLTITSSVQRTADPFIDMVGPQSKVQECTLSNYFQAIRAGITNGYKAQLPTIRNCHFDAPAATITQSYAIGLINIADARVTDNVFIGPTTGGTNYQPDAGIRVCEGDTFMVRGNNIVGHGDALLIVPPAGKSVFAGVISDNLFDSGVAKAGNVVVNGCNVVPKDPTAFVYDLKFSNNWFGNNSGSGLVLDGTSGGHVDGVQVTGCDLVHNAYMGMRVAGASVANWLVTGSLVSGNAQSGIGHQTDGNHFVISNNRIGVAGANQQNQNIGINLFASSARTYYIIQGNELTGNVQNGIFDGTTGTPSRSVTGNISA